MLNGQNNVRHEFNRFKLTWNQQDLIPQHFIDDLIARADIVDVLSKRIDLKKAGKEFKAVCPFHNDKNPSLTISPLKGFYHCFSCGAHGTALGFLMEYENLNFVAAYIILISGLLTSRIPTFSIKRKNLYVKSRPTFFIAFSLIVLSFINFLWLSINILAFIYLLTIPFSVFAWNSNLNKSN